VKRSVLEMADELLAVHAARETVQGTSFSPDVPWQREMEDSFPYVETPDQSMAIAQVTVIRSNFMVRLLGSWAVRFLTYGMARRNVVPAWPRLGLNSVKRCMIMTCAANSGSVGKPCRFPFI
ncbi:MAG: hypothetical protein ACE1ZF_01280, partial [Gemmatimonadales bacterium]